MSHGPFCRYNRSAGRWIGVQDTSSRIEEVKRSADANWLIMVEAPNMQATVVKAAQVRLRKLGLGEAA